MKRPLPVNGSKSSHRWTGGHRFKFINTLPGILGSNPSVIFTFIGTTGITEPATRSHHIDLASKLFNGMDHASIKLKTKHASSKTNNDWQH